MHVYLRATSPPPFFLRKTEYIWFDASLFKKTLTFLSFKSSRMLSPVLWCISCNTRRTVLATLLRIKGTDAIMILYITHSLFFSSYKNNTLWCLRCCDNATTRDSKDLLSSSIGHRLCSVYIHSPCYVVDKMVALVDLSNFRAHNFEDVCPRKRFTREA